MFIKKAFTLEMGRSFTNKYLMLSVVGGDGNRPKGTKVRSGRWAPRVVGHDERHGSSDLRHDKLGEALVLKVDKTDKTFESKIRIN